MRVKQFLESVIPIETIKDESILKYKETLSSLSFSVSPLEDFNNAIIQVLDS